MINSTQTRQLVNYIYGVDNTPDIWAYNWEAYAANPGAHVNDATQANGINVSEYTPDMANRMAEIGLTGGQLILQDLDTRMCNKLYNKDYSICAARWMLGVNNIAGSISYGSIFARNAMGNGHYVVCVK